MEQSKSNWTIVILFALYLSYAIVPIFSLYMGSLVRTILAVLCLMVLIRDYNFMGNLKTLVLLTLIPIFDSLLSLMSGNQSLADVIYVFINVIIPVLIALYLFNQQDALLTKRLFILVSIMWMITLVTSIIGNFIMPGATRDLAASGTISEGFYDATRRLNIGGFDFAYSLPILLPMIIYGVKFTEHRTFCSIVLVAFCIMIIRAEYTLAILASLGILLLLLKKSPPTTKSLTIILVVVVLFFVFLREPMANIVNDIGQLIPSEKVSSRFIDLSYYLRGEELDVQSDLTSRVDKYTQSFDAFLSSPLWGTGEHSGGHSYILGVLACYGILGMGMLFVAVKTVMINFIKPYKNELFYGYLVCSYIVAIFFMFVNPQPFILTTMFLLPLYALSIDSQKLTK